MSTRALVVTVLRMEQLDRNVHGAFQRLRVLVEAVCGAVDAVDILALAERRTALPASGDTQSVELQAHWGVDARVVNGAVGASRPWRPWILEQLRWIFSYRASQAYAGFDSDVNRAALSELLAMRPDLIITHKLPAHEFVSRHAPRHIPVLFDLDDIEYIAFERRARSIRSLRERWVSLAMVPAIRATVGRAVRTARRVFVCSEHDKQILDAAFQSSCSNVAVVPNSCALQAMSEIPEEPVLLFVGTFSYSPNVEAIDHFIERCWPAIRSAVPVAKLRVVGAGAEAVAAFHSQPAGVEFTGFVPDIATEYRRARVVVCPILTGGGTRVKLVEAAAFGMPIVSTQLGAEGLGFENDRHALLRDTDEDFADACKHLLADRDACLRLRAAIHDHASRRFDRPAVVGLVRKYIQGALVDTGHQLDTG